MNLDMLETSLPPKARNSSLQNFARAFATDELAVTDRAFFHVAPCVMDRSELYIAIVTSGRKSLYVVFGPYSLQAIRNTPFLLQATVSYEHLPIADFAYSHRNFRARHYSTTGLWRLTFIYLSIINGPSNSPDHTSVSRLSRSPRLQGVSDEKQTLFSPRRFSPAGPGA